MSDVKLGEKVRISRLGQRDAIHVAVIAVEAGEALDPGQKVQHHYGTVVERHRGTDEPIGIVDPFLTEPVLAGDRFWLVLAPGKARNLAHTWETDDFPEERRENSWDDDDGCRGC